MRRKSLIIKTLAVVLACGMLTACGKGTVTEDGGNVETEQQEMDEQDVQSAEQASEAVESSEASESTEEADNSEEKESSDAADKTQENEESTEAKESIEADLSKDTKESPAPKDGPETKENTEVLKNANIPANKDELEAKYKEYFRNFNGSNKKFIADLDYDESGIQFGIHMEIGSYDKNAYVQMAFSGGTNKAASKNELFFYIMDDGFTYLIADMPGKKSCSKTKMDKGQAENEIPLVDMESVTVSEEQLDKLHYDHEESIDGVIYDVLSCDEKTGDAEIYFHMDRNAQELYKIAATSEGMEVDFLVSDSTKIELPSEAAGATELSREDLTKEITTCVYTMLFSLYDLGN